MSKCDESSFAVLIWPFRSTGITSRGRIGIDAAMTARPLINPWFTDPIDKALLIQNINDLISNIKSGLCIPVQTHWGFLN